MYHARLIYNTIKGIDKLMYLLKFKRKLYVPSSKDKIVIGTMTNAMHTVYILTCSVSTKIYWRKINTIQHQQFPDMGARGGPPDRARIVHGMD